MQTNLMNESNFVAVLVISQARTLQIMISTR